MAGTMIRRSICRLSSSALNGFNRSSTISVVTHLESASFSPALMCIKTSDQTCKFPGQSSRRSFSKLTNELKYSPLLVSNYNTNTCMLRNIPHRFGWANQRRALFEDSKTKDLVIWSNIKELKSSPLPALVLGFSGLIPFVAAPSYMILTQLYLPSITFAQVAYGASILSFLGGVRWGASIPEESLVRPDWLTLGYSVTPSLVAWIGLLMPSPFSLLTVMAGLAGAGYIDLISYGYPAWFKGLRFLLTFVATLSMWTTFMCSFLLSSEDCSEADKKQAKPAE